MITLLDTLGPAIWRASWQAAVLALVVAHWCGHSTAAWWTIAVEHRRHPADRGGRPASAMFERCRPSWARPRTVSRLYARSIGLFMPPRSSISRRVWLPPAWARR